MSSLTDNRKKQIVRYGKIAFRIGVVLLVSWGIWRAVDKSLIKLQAEKFSLAEIHLGWLAAAAGLYFAGTMPSWFFWHRTLVAMDQRPTLWESFRAFSMSHLGKYVPGKAMVVILRTNAVRGPRVDTVLAATSVFVETLTAMAVGALTASLLILIRFIQQFSQGQEAGQEMYRQQGWLLWLALGLLVCAGIPTLPPLFRRAVLLIQTRRGGKDVASSLEGLNFRLMAGGWITIALGWWLMGMSLWAVLKAVPGVELGISDLPLVTACTALAVVAGFVSMLPGGVGVREAVVMTLLAPHAGIGSLAALAGAVLMRLCWLAAELAIFVLLFIVKIFHQNETSPAADQTPPPA